MYKVFIYNKPIFFTEEQDLSSELDSFPVFTCESIKERDKIIKQLKKKPASIVVKGKSIKKLKKLFFGDFKILEAAGGVVVNRNNKVLFIFRNGFWDLPKGKIEKGEKKKIAAVREVEEECGISNPIIERKLLTTYHTYELKGRNILKPTYWYEMRYEGDEELIPQLEEGITEVKWVDISYVEVQMSNTFEAIKDVIGKYKGE